MDRPAVLQNVTVVEATKSIGGALCGRLLAEFGADVVLAEPPEGHVLRSLTDDGHFFETVAAGKRSVVIDDWEGGIAAEEGVVSDLLTGADVFLTDDGGIAAGLDEESIRAWNGGVIYCSITPFGRTGPEADRKGLDPTVQAMGGITATSGFPGRPPAVTAAPIADALGAIIGCGSILTQMYADSTDGIDVSSQDTLLPLLTTFLPEYFATNEPIDSIGNHHPMIAPWNTYRAKDGWVYFIALTDRDWKRFVAMSDLEDLEGDPQYETARKRRRKVDEIDAIVEEWISRFTVEEVLERTEQHDLTAAPIYDVGRAFEDDNLEYRGMVIDSNGHTIAGSPFNMSRSPGRVSSPAPDLGDEGGDRPCRR